MSVKINFVALVMLAIPNAALAATCFSYEPATVTVSGTIAEKEFYGPPNYGLDPAHDRKDYLPILTVDKPFCVDANTSDSPFDVAQNNVEQMQMVYNPMALPFKEAWIGRHVAVTGILFHADNAQHHTPVLIRVTGTRVLAN